jgi:hypothetical protein
VTRRLLVLVLLLPWLAPADREHALHAQRGADNVVLITLDGARTEEIFGGLDLDVLRSTMTNGRSAEASASYRRFWADTREERRRRLMPFFWRLVTEHGSIAGDTDTGSAVRLRNQHWFSYPGYAEILLGEPHDAVINSNSPIRNPFPTVLEAIRAHLELPPDKVATFASWFVFSDIVEHTEGATYVNAGIEAVDAPGDEVDLLNELQTEMATPWAGARYDAFTFRQAMHHLAAARPRVLYLALHETDDWAHQGRYDQVLEALSRSDAYLKRLWTWLRRATDSLVGAGPGPGLRRRADRHPAIDVILQPRRGD